MTDRDNPRRLPEASGFYIPDFEPPTTVTLGDVGMGGSEGQYALHLPETSHGYSPNVDCEDWPERVHRRPQRCRELKFE